MSYPLVLRFETPDGGGEARKEEKGEAWVVSYPTGDLRVYGTRLQMRARLMCSLRKSYPDLPTVTLTLGGREPRASR